MTKIKICGLKRLQDIEYVNEFLPDFIGFVFAGTKRKITDEKAKEFKTVLNPRIKAVGVFVNDTLEHISFLANNNIIDIIQLHGDEDKEYIENLRKITNKQIIKAVRVKNSQSVIETKKIIKRSKREVTYKRLLIENIFQKILEIIFLQEV